MSWKTRGKTIYNSCVKWEELDFIVFVSVFCEWY